MGEDCARDYVKRYGLPTKLHVEHGVLYAGQLMLTQEYAAGDYDTCPWPVRGKKKDARLRRALYDAREMGFVKGPIVLLPNGKEFAIE